MKSGGAKCRRTGDAAEIELDAADIASAYLGAHSFSTLSRANRVRVSTDSIQRADGIFRTPRAPWYPEIF